MRKVCILVGYYPINRGGSEYQAYLLAQTLRERCETFYISVGQTEEGCFVDRGVKVYTLRSPRFLCLKNVFCLLKSRIFAILEQERPDVIYQRVAYSGTGIAAMYCRRSGCRLVWHIASERDVMPGFGKGDRWRIVSYAERRFRDYGIRNADVIIGQTGHQDELLQENYGRRCDLIAGNAHPEPLEVIRKEEPITVVWVANVKPLKQPEMFIRLARTLHRRCEARFVMVGRPASGRYQKQLEKAMEGLLNFHYRGEQSIDEVNLMLARAHVLVNTSLYEGFPNTFVQAWFRRVPVVSLNVDPDDVLKKEGLGFHSQSFEGVTRDAEQLITDPRLRESMGTKAREYALRHHSAAPNLAKIASLLCGVQ